MSIDQRYSKEVKALALPAANPDLNPQNFTGSPKYHWGVTLENKLSQKKPLHIHQECPRHYYILYTNPLLESHIFCASRMFSIIYEFILKGIHNLNF